MKFLKIIYIFLKDLSLLKKNINHKISESSYKLTRILFMISDGLLLRLISYFLNLKSKPSESFSVGYIKFNAESKEDANYFHNQIINSRLINKEVKDQRVRLNGNSIDFKYYQEKNLMRLDINSEDILKDIKFTNFLLNEKWLKEVKNILGVEPYIIGVDSWITLPSPININNYVEIGKVVSSQMWHRDCDNLRDIKLFTYLTDVKDENDGPFEFICNTHHFTFFNPFNYIMGFSGMRVGDDYIQKKYKKKIVSLYGNSGDSFIIDTRGLHRGKTINKKNFYRIMFEVYFSIHPYGKNKKIVGPKNNWPSYDIWKKALKERINYNFLFESESIEAKKNFT